jgi:tRNA A-37 threonylcarbamoyl transferase component Bud32
MQSPTELIEHREWPASIEEVWALVSNTDAFNRIAGFGMRFEQTPDGWQGRQSIGPLTVTWHERPMQYETPAGFTSVRRYRTGPIAMVTTDVRLTERPQGTALDYRVQFEPRGLAALVMPIVPFLIRGQIRKGLDAIEAGLTGGEQVFDPPPPLSAEADAALSQALGHCAAEVRESIASRVRRAPLVVQHELRPLRIAEADDLDPEAVIAACLQATNAGALQMAWQLLCPRCRGAKGETDILTLAREQVHCDTCAIRYDSALADNVEAVFRPAPHVRADPVTVDCLMSPSRTPHVLARFDVRSDGEAQWEVDTAVGCYRLECDDAVALVEVSEEHAVGGQVVLSYADGRISPAVVRIPPGRTRFTLRNRSDSIAELQFARRWRPARPLTAARLLSSPALRELIPVAQLAEGISTRSFHGFAVVVEVQPDTLPDVQSTLDAVLPKLQPVGDTLWVTATTDANTAMGAAARIVARGRPVGIGLAQGVVLELKHDDAVEICGEAVEEALEALRRVGIPQVAVAPGSVAAFEGAFDDTVRFRPRGDEPAVVGFAALLDGTEGAPPPEPPPAFDPDEPLPESVAGYPVLREIDRGGMGRVFEVLDPKTAERLAVKQLLPQVYGDLALQLFFREAYYAMQIAHPNVVAFRDWGEAEGKPYLVMECLVGRSLADELRRSGLFSVDRAVPMLAAILDALAAIHSVGLVHRDVKPQNLFVLQDKGAAPAGVKLLDFGLMRRAGRSRDETFAGTPDYAAPEQVLMGAVDARTDVYAVGLVAYRMLTGKLPFKGKTVGERAVRRIDTDVADHPGLARLAPILSRALQPEPDQRYPSAEAMRDAIRAL